MLPTTGEASWARLARQVDACPSSGLPDQPDGDRQVEVGPCPIGGEHVGGNAADGERQAAPVTQGQCPPARQRAQCTGKFGVVRVQRFDVTPAALSSSRRGVTSIAASTSLPTTSARFTAPRTPPASSSATRSLPGSSWISASTADASRTVIRWQQRVGARRATPRRTSATPVPDGPTRAIARPHPVDAAARVAARPGAGAADRREPVPTPPEPPPGSPGDLADPSPLWHPQNKCATSGQIVARGLQSSRSG